METFLVINTLALCVIILAFAPVVINMIFKYIGRLETAIMVMGTIDLGDEVEIDLVRETYGHFTVFLTDYDWVRDLVKRSENERLFWYCLKAHGYFVADAIRYFNSIGMAYSQFSFRGTISLEELLAIPEAIIALTEPSSIRSKLMHVYCPRHSHKTFFGIGAAMYEIDDAELHSAIKENGFTLYGLRMRKNNSEAVWSQINKCATYANAIKHSPKIASLMRRFAYSDWSHRKLYKQLRKKTRHAEEWTDGTFVYLMDVDYYGGRWPVAMGLLNECENYVDIIHVRRY